MSLRILSAWTLISLAKLTGLVKLKILFKVLCSKFPFLPGGSALSKQTIAGGKPELLLTINLKPIHYLI